MGNLNIIVLSLAKPAIPSIIRNRVKKNFDTVNIFDRRKGHFGSEFYIKNSFIGNFQNFVEILLIDFKLTFLVNLIHDKNVTSYVIL